MAQNRCFHRFVIFAAVVCTALSSIRPALALDADEILLVTNKNSPESQSLAKLYCQLRNVPADRIVALDLPADEEMSFDTYETGVVGQVRQYLTDHQLKTKIKCLLTFYGVPFRIRNKQNTPAEDNELAELKDLKAATAGEMKDALAHFEGQAIATNPSFTPMAGDSLADCLSRMQDAIKAITAKIPEMTDVGQKSESFAKIVTAMGIIAGDAELDNRLGAGQRNDASKPADARQHWIDLHDAISKAREQVQELQAKRWDREARSNLRLVSRAHFGLIGLSRVIDAQIEYLTTGETGSATDSELSLLWWDYYSRKRWIGNPMYLSFAGRAPPTLMVMRLDGPDPAIVERMMRTSVQVEKTGLQGIIAIDARGLQPIDAKGNLSEFGEFDETLRHLAFLVRSKTKLKIALDDQDLVFPPHYAKDVACYCGWYSVNHYVPGCDFNAGAVGYHIASYEMITLHSPGSGWVRGLLFDGVVGTLGSCAEPYLSAFPKPDDFFPLLLTGKLTLAEVYWKTTPMASWMISFIGDPLYTPYKVDPAMAVDDLPPGLRKAFN